MLLQKKALTTHQKVNHEGRRDFVCPHETCGRAFGYKHLLQRHVTKLHAPQSGSESSSEDDRDSYHEPQLAIDSITGKSYNDLAIRQVSASRKIRCPHPDMHELLPEWASRQGSKKCEYVFSRAYDLRRHLKSEHGVDIDKDVVGNWVQGAKAQ